MNQQPFLVPEETPTIYRVPTKYTTAQLLFAHRHAQSHPNAVYHPVPSKGDETRGDCPDLTAEQWLSWFLSKLLEKIQSHDPRAPDPSWRKMDADWQTEAARTARQVNTPRLRVTWVPKDLRTKLAHRLTDPTDV